MDSQLAAAKCDILAHHKWLEGDGRGARPGFPQNKIDPVMLPWPWSPLRSALGCATFGLQVLGRAGTCICGHRTHGPLIPDWSVYAYMRPVQGESEVSPKMEDKYRLKCNGCQL